MKKFAAVALALLALPAACSREEPERAVDGAARPNLILIVTDDQRWDTLGCMGNESIRTPHLDALAKDGVLFTNAFCTTPLCAPSRATLQSGQYARRHGIWNFVQSFSPKAWKQTFPAILRRNGYRTGFVGKWGIGRQLPAAEFDFFEGFAGQGRYFALGDAEREEHLTRRQGAQALRFLDGVAADPRPFALQIHFKAPHCDEEGIDAAWQFPTDKAHRALYEDVTIPAPATATEADFENLPEFVRTSEARARWKVMFDGDAMYEKNIKDYWRLITGVDDVVGEIVAALEAKGLASNTVIVFTSDNGFYTGDYGLAGKWFFHDASLRVPLIVHDPRLPAAERGRPVDAFALTVDVAPTLLDLAGIAPPAAMQGRSLVPLLSGARDPISAEWRTDFLFEELFDHEPIPKSEGLRTERWKYVRWPEQQPLVEQLFDLAADPLERHDVVHDPANEQALDTLRARFAELAAQAQ